MNNSNIAVDAAKCLACGNCVDRCIMDNLRLSLPPCRQASPLGINYQSIIRLLGAGKDADAARELRRSTPFGGLIAALGDDNASKVCSRGRAGGSLNMAGLLDYLVRTQPDIVYSADVRLPASSKKAAVIGAGSAGLQAAFGLRMGGHAVTVFEAAQAGNLLASQDSETSVPADIMEKTIQMLKNLGIEFHFSSPKGQSDMNDLRAEYGAVVCACGKGAVLPADANGYVEGNLFAAGTCIKNQKSLTALQAMASGAKAAHAACNLLEGFDVDYESNERVARGLETFQGMPCEMDGIADQEPVRSKGVFTAEEAKMEASRCLGCGRPFEKNMTCWYCLPCEVVCPTQALHVRIPYLIR